MIDKLLPVCPFPVISQTLISFPPPPSPHVHKIPYLSNKALSSSPHPIPIHYVLLPPSSLFCFLSPSLPTQSQDQVTNNVPTMLEALFECTLEMINKDLEEFPEHRINFFRMLQSITIHCFDGKTASTQITITFQPPLF